MDINTWEVERGNSRRMNSGLKNTYDDKLKDELRILETVESDVNDSHSARDIHSLYFSE